MKRFAILAGRGLAFLHLQWCRVCGRMWRQWLRAEGLRAKA
jgi:hypothetical protein